MTDPEDGSGETLPAPGPPDGGTGEPLGSLPAAVPAVYRPPNRLRRGFWWAFAAGLVVMFVVVVLLTSR